MSNCLGQLPLKQWYMIYDANYHVYIYMICIYIHIRPNHGIWNLAQKQLGPWQDPCEVAEMGARFFPTLLSFCARGSMCHVEKPMLQHRSIQDIWFSFLHGYVWLYYIIFITWIGYHSLPNTFRPSVANLHSNGIALQTGLAGSQPLTLSWYYENLRWTSCWPKLMSFCQTWCDQSNIQAPSLELRLQTRTLFRWTGKALRVLLGWIGNQHPIKPAN